MPAPGWERTNHGLAMAATERLLASACSGAPDAGAVFRITVTVCPRQCVVLQWWAPLRHANGCGDGTDKEVALLVGIHTRDRCLNMKCLSVLSYVYALVG